MPRSRLTSGPPVPGGPRDVAAAVRRARLRQAGAAAARGAAAGGARVLPPGRRSRRLGPAGPRRRTRSGWSSSTRPAGRATSPTRPTCPALQPLRDAGRDRGRLRGHQLRPAPVAGRPGRHRAATGTGTGSPACCLTGSRPSPATCGTTPCWPGGPGKLGAQTVVFNHGVHPHEGYARHADMLGHLRGSVECLPAAGRARSGRGPGRPTGSTTSSTRCPPEHLANAFLLAGRRRAGCCVRHRPRRRQPVQPAAGAGARPVRRAVGPAAPGGPVTGRGAHAAPSASPALPLEPPPPAAARRCP